MREGPKPEQVKIFFSHREGKSNILEPEVNKWLKENEGAVNIVERTVSISAEGNSGSIFTVITIWYRPKE